MAVSKVPDQAVFSRANLERYIPSLRWLLRYRSQNLAGDLMAGLIVAILLIPQGMAYALLAGLPPEIGLYASILPLFLYGLLGSSRTLSVGPTAITAIMIAASVGALAAPGSSDYLRLTLLLAFMVGLIQIAMGLLRLGVLVNFISHPVLSGFSSAAAFIIAISQIKILLGMSMPQIEGLPEQIGYLVGHLGENNPVALLISVSAILILLLFKFAARPLLRRLDIPPAWRDLIAKGGPFVVVMLGALAAWMFNLPETAGLRVVGNIPASLPPLTAPGFSLEAIQRLGPAALTLALIIYMESITIAKALASKRREKIGANQELFALGISNLGAAFTGGHPVAGGFSRSVVNFSAGAQTGLASMITAALIALALLFLTPLFYFLPQAVLAAIVVVAIIELVDLHTLQHAWRYNKPDAASLIATFFAVLLLGIESGILVGVGLTLLLYLWRTSRPHIAVVGRVGESEHFRNVQRHPVHTLPHVLAVRLDESLYFANAQYLENFILETIADQKEIQHLLLIGSAINFIDASALETLENIIQELKDAGVTVHLAEIKGPVMDRLQRVNFMECMGNGKVFLSTHEAFEALGESS